MLMCPQMSAKKIAILGAPVQFISGFSAAPLLWKKRQPTNNR